MTRNAKRGPATAIVATCCLAAALLTSCGDDSGSGPKGSGVSEGATKEQYAAAFEDVEPITIIAQSVAGKGSVIGRPLEEYAAAVEEWSGGKIEFEMSYSSAIAGPTEVIDALNDGRLDLSIHQALAQRDEFPVTNAITEVGAMLNSPTPVVGELMAHGWLLETAYATSDMEREYNDHGTTLLLPFFTGGHAFAWCDRPLTSKADFKGVQFAATSAVAASIATELGATPVSLTFAEIYEALERGVADCVSTAHQVGVLGGFLNLTPYLSYDPSVGYPTGPGELAFGKQAWDDLPLVAQQLLFDRLDVYIQANIEKTWDAMKEAMTATIEAGGKVTRFDSDVVEVFEKVRDSYISAGRKYDFLENADKFVDTEIETIEKWKTLVSNDLGYSDDLGYENWTQYEPGSIDLTAYIDRLRTDVLSPQRPE